MNWWATNHTGAGDNSLEAMDVAVPADAMKQASLSTTPAPTQAPGGGYYTGPVTGTTYILAIQKLGLRAPMIPVGKTASGNMDTPYSLHQVGWYKYGARPGEAGNVVLAAHYGAPDQDGVFRSLGQLNPGDQLTIVVSGQPNLTYQVTDKALYPANATAPLGRIFGQNGGKYGLNLITCAGNWDGNTRTYDQRLVVYTELVR